jgi:hypothetical protein
MKKIYLFIFSILIFSFIHAQWSPKNALPVAALNSSDIVTKQTSSGKTFIAFYSQNAVTGNYDMRAQLLDFNGNRLFGDTGVLVSYRNSGSATFVFNTCLDKDDNLIITFQRQKGSGYDIVAYKIDSLGNSLWGKKGTGIILGSGLAPYPVALSTNEVVVAWPDNNGGISYQKISEAGIAEWDSVKEFTSAHTVTRPQLVAQNNGTFGMVFQSVDFAPFYTHLYEQRFDNNGNALWASPVQLSNYVTASYAYYSVIDDADTTYVGYYGNPPSQNSFNGFIQRVNADGSLPWNINGTAFNDYSGIHQPFTFYVNIAHEHGMPNVWAVATTSDPNQFRYGISVQNISASTGAKLLDSFGKKLFGIDSVSNQVQGTLSLCEHNPLFIFTNITNKLYAAALDKNGDFAWANKKVLVGKTINQKDRFALTKAFEHQLIAVWQEDRGNGDMPYAQSISCDGTAGANEFAATDISEKIKPTSTTVKVFPNPVKDLLTLNISSPAQDKINIVITDLTGKMLRQQTANIFEGNNQVQINVNNFITGIYFIKTISTTGKETILPQKFVKE